MADTATMEGKAEACLEWAKGWPQLDGYLKLNALVTEDGDATLSTMYNDVAVLEYIDGTKLRRYTFVLRIVVPWSDGYDATNAQANALASNWLDWVNKQYPDNVPDWPGAEIVDIQAAQNVPALDAVYEDDQLAQYLIQAIITYRE